MSNISSDKLEKLNKKLKDNLFINGSQPTSEDAEIFEKIKHNFKLDKSKYPNIFAWLQFISLYEDNVIQSWKKINNNNKKEKNEFDLILDKIKNNKNKNKENSYSIILLEIKIWDADQDLESLAKKIISTIKKDGLSWNTGYKLEEVAFGVKKLIIAFLAEDDKCSVQEIVDELESWENDIQSVDVVEFIKIKYIIKDKNFCL